ncbi:MAG TPA: hypothetical protein VN112_00785 [Ensifer sp.]|nr:hypothetical protein [Ensifer sp.]
MNSIFSKVLLAAAIGLGTLSAIPATASADEVIVVRDGWHHGWHHGWRDRYDYRPRYERYDGPRYGYWDRPWHRHHHVRCFENRWGRMICER